MPASYPADLPLPMRGHSRTQPAAFGVDQPRRGYGYVQPTGTDVPAFWSLTWRLTAQQARVFRNWFRYTLERGTISFLMSLRTEFGLLTYDLNFLPDGLLPAQQIGSDLWEYSATVMARDLLNEEAVETTDSLFASVLLLLHGEGADGGTTITDSSGAPLSPSGVGGVSTQIEVHRFGAASIYSPAGLPLKYNAAGLQNFWLGDAAVELWAWADPAGSSSLLSNRAGGESFGWAWTRNSLRARINGVWSDTQISWAAPSNSAWHFYQLIKSGTTITAAVDGVTVGTKTGVTSMDDKLVATGTHWHFGQSDDASENRWNGYFDEVRFTKGASRPVTLPTGVFPNTGP